MRKSGVFTHEVLFFKGVVRKKSVFTHDIKGRPGSCRALPLADVSTPGHGQGEGPKLAWEGPE